MEKRRPILPEAAVVGRALAMNDQINNVLYNVCKEGVEAKNSFLLTGFPKVSRAEFL